MCGKRSCIARNIRSITVPSPTPASKTRTAGGRGWMLPSSSVTRLAITHFSLQVWTKRRYFCRLSKKRKLRCGSGSLAGSAEVAVGEEIIGGRGWRARVDLLDCASVAVLRLAAIKSIHHELAGSRCWAKVLDRQFKATVRWQRANSIRMEAHAAFCRQSGLSVHRASFHGTLRRGGCRRLQGGRTAVSL